MWRTYPTSASKEPANAPKRSGKTCNTTDVSGKSSEQLFSISLFLSEDLGDIALDHVDPPLVYLHAVHAYLGRKNKDGTILLEVLVQFIRQPVHVTVIGKPVLSAQYEDKVVVFPEITRQDQEIIPVGELREIARNGVLLLNLSDVRQGFR